VARDIIEDLDPQWLVLVGIAGGVPADEFSLGDVVAATRLHDFCVEAALQNASPEYAIAGGPMHKAVQDLFAFLPAMEEGLQGWNDETSIGMPLPPVQLRASRFYGDKEWRSKVRQSLKRHFGPSSIPRPPLFTTGSIASSDRLIKDSETIKEWRSVARQILAVEMELAGIYRAARRKDREYPILAIRGISDIVGFKRHHDWTTYACHSAAAFTYALIKARPIEPKVPEGVLNMNSSARSRSGAEYPDELERLLNKIRRSSQIAAQDAGLVVYDEALGGEICLDQNLYVNRSVEKRVDEILETCARDPKVLLVIGEAGYGKTSLLWHLYNSLKGRKELEPWFIKSTLLMRHKYAGQASNLKSVGDVDPEAIVNGVKAATDQSLHPILLLDTVDLLLHQEANRDLLLELLSLLLESDCTIIATCRPQEALLLHPIEHRRITLREYDDLELQEALEKHVARFYEYSIPRENENHVERILNAVARGLPIREVCTNPLTLRMLFTIYAPAAIPDDINIFGL